MKQHLCESCYSPRVTTYSIKGENKLLCEDCASYVVEERTKVVLNIAGEISTHTLTKEQGEKLKEQIEKGFEDEPRAKTSDSGNRRKNKKRVRESKVLQQDKT